jgi:FixJ family two-component response regulator
MAERPLIAVIDDDHSVRESLRGLFRSVGFAAQAFASGGDFLQSDDLPRADCVILDVRMPGMGGLELQRRLIASRPDVPVIFMTAHDDAGTRLQALSGGAVDFLVKPFSEEALLDAVQAALGSK